jgi:hypothetical protein
MYRRMKSLLFMPLIGQKMRVMPARTSERQLRLARQIR